MYIYTMLEYYVFVYILLIYIYYMVTDRIMEKKETFNLDRRRLRPIFP